MPKVTTGHHAIWGADRVGRAQELLRGAAYAHAEKTNNPGDTRTLGILRLVQTAPGSTAARIPATYEPVAGLDGILGTVWLPKPWTDHGTETGITLRASERMVTLVDIPAAGDTRADAVLLTDRIVFDDDVYGDAATFEVVEVGIIVAGIAHIRVNYAHADEQP